MKSSLGLARLCLATSRDAAEPRHEENREMTQAAELLREAKPRHEENRETSHATRQLPGSTAGLIGLVLIQQTRFALATE